MQKLDGAAWKASNQEVIRGLEAGDRKLVEEWLQRLAAYFRRNWSIVAHDAEDLAQETMVKAYELLDEFSGDVPIERWLYGIARNTGRHAARAFLRKKGQDMEPLDELEDWDELLSEEDFADRKLAAMYMDGFLERLEPEQQSIVQWHIYERLSWATISERLGISENAAQTRFQRILKKLGQWIEAEEPWLKNGRGR